MALADRLFRLFGDKQRELGGSELTAERESVAGRVVRAHRARENAGALRAQFEVDLRSFQQGGPHSAPLLEPRDKS